MTAWDPSRDEAVRRLERFVPQAGRAYAARRNFDPGPGTHSDVSTLSPWIRHRVILEQEVVSATLARHSFAAAEKFIQEVFWRTYWKGWLELRPSVWTDYRQAVERQVGDLDRDADLRRRWEEATQGRTGIDCFDAWTHELVQTGYLHNHARMWFASIWIFTLELPWELGADFFLRHLLDGDPASNTLSWRWVGGLQTRGKTYLARPDNIARYTDGRFNPVGRLSNSAKPLDGPAPPPPRAAPQPVQWDAAVPAGLLLTEEDLHPDFLVASNTPFRAAAALRTTKRRSPLAVSCQVRDFVGGAIADACTRVQAETGISVALDHPGDHPNSLVEWARAAGVQQIVTAHVPVGPTAGAIAELTEALADQGIALIPALRRWDHVSWPHATRGFFPFREKIPTILSHLRSDLAPAA